MALRSQQISSFDDIQATLDNFQRVDHALASGVARGVMQAVRMALSAGGNPLQAQDESGRHLFIQAIDHEEGEDLVCALLGQMPAMVQVDRVASSELLVTLEDGHLMGVSASEEDQGHLDRLEGFLRDLMLWKTNFPLRENESVDLIRVRHVNRRLLDGVSTGNMAAVEMSMAEGACVLTATPDGVPALALACGQSNHAQLMGAILANDPSVALVEQDGRWYLRNLPYARISKGGAPYIAADPVEMGLASGHFVAVDPAVLPECLRAHLKTLERFEAALGGLTTEYFHRGMPTQLRWPNQVDFQRLLAEHYGQSLERVQAEVGSPTNAGTAGEALA